MASKNRNYIRADRAIREGLLNLLEHKKLEDLTIQDILDAAMVTRSTFYQHYHDKYEVIEKMQDAFIAELMSLTFQLPSDKTNSHAGIDTVLYRFFQDNRQQLRILMNVHTDVVDFRQRLQEVFYKLYLQSDPSVSILDARILSGIFTEILAYSLDHDDVGQNLSVFVLRESINITKQLFQMNTKEAEEDLLDVIGRHHNSGRRE